MTFKSATSGSRRALALSAPALTVCFVTGFLIFRLIFHRRDARSKRLKVSSARPSTRTRGRGRLAAACARTRRDLYERSPAIYWTDFLLSIAGAWGLAAVYFLAPPWSAIQLAAFVLSAVLFLRAGTFMHELVHLRRGQMPWFGRAWNLLQGIPLLMPWIMYRNHADHHSTRLFGTPADAEYLPLASSPAARDPQVPGADSRDAALHGDPVRHPRAAVRLSPRPARVGADRRLRGGREPVLSQALPAAGREAPDDRRGALLRLPVYDRCARVCGYDHRHAPAEGLPAAGVRDGPELGADPGGARFWQSRRPDDACRTDERFHQHHRPDLADDLPVPGGSALSRAASPVPGAAIPQPGEGASAPDRAICRRMRRTTRPPGRISLRSSPNSGVPRDGPRARTPPCRDGIRNPAALERNRTDGITGTGGDRGGGAGVVPGRQSAKFHGREQPARRARDRARKGARRRSHRGRPSRAFRGRARRGARARRAARVRAGRRRHGAGDRRPPGPARARVRDAATAGPRRRPDQPDGRRPAWQRFGAEETGVRADPLGPRPGRRLRAANIATRS